MSAKFPRGGGAGPFLARSLLAHIRWRSSYYAVTHVRSKNSIIQGRSSNVVKVIFPYHKELLVKERVSKVFPLRVPILKRDAIEENHC